MSDTVLCDQVVLCYAVNGDGVMRYGPLMPATVMPTM